VRHADDAGDVLLVLDDGVELGLPRRGDGGDELPRRDLGEEDARHAVRTSYSALGSSETWTAARTRAEHIDPSIRADIASCLVDGGATGLAFYSRARARFRPRRSL